MYLSVSKCFIFCFIQKFRPGQECTKYELIAALNKTPGDFITLYVFLSLDRFKTFITYISSI